MKPIGAARPPRAGNPCTTPSHQSKSDNIGRVHEECARITLPSGVVMTMILTAEERAQLLGGSLDHSKVGSLQNTTAPTTFEVCRLRKELQQERAARQEVQAQFETKWEAVRQGMNWLKEQLCNMNRQCCLQQAQFERMLQQERTMRQEAQAQFKRKLEAVWKKTQERFNELEEQLSNFQPRGLSREELEFWKMKDTRTSFRPRRMSREEFEFCKLKGLCTRCGSNRHTQINCDASIRQMSDFLGTGLQKQMKTANPMASFALSSHPAQHSEHTKFGGPRDRKPLPLEHTGRGLASAGCLHTKPSGLGTTGAEVSKADRRARRKAQKKADKQRRVLAAKCKASMLPIQRKQLPSQLHDGNPVQEKCKDQLAKASAKSPASSKPKKCKLSSRERDLGKAIYRWIKAKEFSTKTTRLAWCKRFIDRGPFRTWVDSHDNSDPSPEHALKLLRRHEQHEYGHFVDASDFSSGVWYSEPAEPTSHGPSLNLSKGSQANREMRPAKQGKRPVSKGYTHHVFAASPPGPRPGHDHTTSKKASGHTYLAVARHGASKLKNNSASRVPHRAPQGKGHVSHPKKDVVTKKLNIPKGAVGFILRQGGRHKEKLCAATGAKISFELKKMVPGDRDHQVATITGTEYQVSRAANDLSNLVKWHLKRSKRRPSRSPTRSKPQPTNDRPGSSTRQDRARETPDVTEAQLDELINDTVPELSAKRHKPSCEDQTLTLDHALAVDVNEGSNLLNSQSNFNSDGYDYSGLNCDTSSDEGSEGNESSGDEQSLVLSANGGPQTLAGLRTAKSPARVHVQAQTKQGLYKPSVDLPGELRGRAPATPTHARSLTPLCVFARATEIFGSPFSAPAWGLCLNLPSASTCPPPNDYSPPVPPLHKPTPAPQTPAILTTEDMD